MKLLLDTNALIWFLRGDEALGATARHAIEDAATTAFVSPVSAFEIALKRALG